MNIEQGLPWSPFVLFFCKLFELLELDTMFGLYRLYLQAFFEARSVLLHSPKEVQDGVGTDVGEGVGADVGMSVQELVKKLSRDRLAESFLVEWSKFQNTHGGDRCR